MSAHKFIEGLQMIRGPAISLTAAYSYYLSTSSPAVFDKVIATPNESILAISTSTSITGFYLRFEIHIDSESDELSGARHLLKWLANTPTRSSITIHVLMKQLTRLIQSPALKPSTAIDDLLSVNRDFASPWVSQQFPLFRPGLEHLHDLTLCITNGSTKDLLALVRTLGDGYIPGLRKLTLALPQVAFSRAVESVTTLSVLARLIGRSQFAGLETMTFTLIVTDSEQSGDGATPTAIAAAQAVFDALARVRADFIISATVIVSLANCIHPFVPLWIRAVPFENPHTTTPTRSSSRLPPEIWNMIIRCLNPYLDRTTLEQCALVSYGWLAASRRALQRPWNFTIKEAYLLFNRAVPGATLPSTSFLRLPELSVKADSIGENYSPSWNTLLACMTDRVPTLRTFRIEGLTFDSRIQAQHAAACLSAFTHLTKLELSDSRFPSFTLLRLLRAAALSKLLPFVYRFYFAHPSHTDLSALSSFRHAEYVELKIPAATTETLLAIATGIAQADSVHLHTIRLWLPVAVLTNASAAAIAKLAVLTSGAAFARAERAYFYLDMMGNPESGENAVVRSKAVAALGTRVAEIVARAWPPSSRRVDVEIYLERGEGNYLWKGVSRADLQESAETTEAARGDVGTSESP
ncbi:uncharacterized protein BXZ73DRAFT_99038 [Epithele typhae]|uniref:uncharacterized protein n=1 Tax=Epithele typhae TaxID=378194 RepID=UPI0020074731|nr:uncharacterized protein BXZ73DRAFT_99038 [Epithele typhae]KAH9940043.1 hypothetical protein BXZ73DRAFT_99038 [Epithele typhae]